MPALHINLNPNHVAAPIQRAAVITSDVVAASLTAFADGELTKPQMPNQFISYQIVGPELTSEQRRAMYQNWLLAKGFQDLSRGIRETLEEAFVFSTLVGNRPRGGTLEEIKAAIDAIRKRAAVLKFPQLFAKVNQGLSSPIEFEREFLSMQKVRNCLEHRNGIVGRQDIDDGGDRLTLSFPRWKFFYMRDAQEIEIAPDERVNAHDEQPYVDILVRITTRSKTYGVGERITFAPSEFSEIAMACSFFGNELASKLPPLPSPS